ncbi:MAG: hypothetical protein I8H75_04200 [Myxococcaceae bacterium]|nr:hypothetical protein [Myxococcaceae bacterium]
MWFRVISLAFVIIFIGESFLFAMPPKADLSGQIEVLPRSLSQIMLHAFIRAGNEQEVLDYINRLECYRSELTDRARAERGVYRCCHDLERGCVLQRYDEEGNFFPQDTYVSTTLFSNEEDSFQLTSFRYWHDWSEVTGYPATRTYFYLLPFENIFEINRERQNALHLAAEAGMVDVVLRLLNLGLPINLQNAGGVTPLMDVAKGSALANAEQLIQLFIERGADLRIRDLSGRCARHHALESRLNFPTETLDKLVFNPLGRSPFTGETPIERLQRVVFKTFRQIQLGENRWGMDFYREQTLTGNAKQSLQKKLFDQISLIGTIEILDKIMLLGCINIHAGLSIMAQAMEIIGSTCDALSKETKGGYLADLSWSELGFLSIMGTQKRFSEDMKLLLPVAHDIWMRCGDLVALKKKLQQMIDEYDQWEAKNNAARSDLALSISPDLLRFHAFIRYFYDLSSLDRIIDLATIAAKLNMSSPNDRDILLTVVRKIADTSKYELLGANLSPAVKAMIPDMSWERLQKVRNILKEADQKRPEVRKLLKSLLQQGTIANLSLDGLRQDIIQLSIQLQSVREVLRKKPNEDAYQFFDRIVIIYMHEDSSENLPLFYLSVEDQEKLSVLIDQAYKNIENNNSFIFEEKEFIKRQSKQLQGIKKSIKTLEARKQELSEGIQKRISDSEEKVDQEKKRIQKACSCVQKALQKKRSLSPGDVEKVLKHLSDSQSNEFLVTYERGFRFKNIRAFAASLNRGGEEKPEDRTPSIRAHYLMLAMEAWNRFLKKLFPDSAQRTRVVEAMQRNKYYLNSVSEDSRHIEHSLRRYNLDLEYKMGLHTDIIHFKIFMNHAGAFPDQTMRNIMEHIDVLHESYAGYSQVELFKTFQGYLGMVEGEKQRLESELVASGVTLPTHDSDSEYIHVPTFREDVMKPPLLLKSTHKPLTNKPSNIISIPGDGDCLFNSILEGMRRLSREINIENAAALRRILANEMHNNISMYRHSIELQIVQNIRDNDLAGYPPALTSEMHDLETEQEITQFGQDTVPRYIHALGEGELWGGGIELGIIARLYNLRIFVYQRGGTIHMINEEAVGAELIELDYTGDHYNLIANHIAVPAQRTAIRVSKSVVFSPKL